MKNSECTIYIMFKDRWLQKFRKEAHDWKEYSCNGIVRLYAAEQMISHVLPTLIGNKRTECKPSKLNLLMGLRNS